MMNNRKFFAFLMAVVLLTLAALGGGCGGGSSSSGSGNVTSPSNTTYKGTGKVTATDGTVLTVTNASLAVGEIASAGSVSVAAQSATASFSCILSDDKGATGSISRRPQTVSVTQSGSDWTFAFTDLEVVLNTVDMTITLGGTIPAVTMSDGASYTLTDFIIGVEKSGEATNRNQFIDAMGSVVDDLQAIASSALSNRKVITAIDDIVRQYLVTSGDTTAKDRAIGRTFAAADVTSKDLSNNPSFDKAALVKLWSEKHITVENNKVQSLDLGTSDFQLTITSSDSHVTKLTVTPTSTTGYWQAFGAASSVLDALFSKNPTLPESLKGIRFLLCAYTYASAKIEVTYDGTKLLDGTISVSYPGKNSGDMVYLNTPHTTTYALTLYPQDNKTYTVGIDLTRETKSTGDNSVSNATALKMYRKGSVNTTILDVTAGADATVPSGSTRPSAASLTKLDLNIADRIRLAESSSLDLVKLMGLYVTGENATEETVKNNVANINTLLSNAGLSVYLNESSNKAGDIRALASKIGTYPHARFGIQFVGASEPELVRNIANQDDLKQIQALLGKVAPQVQVLTQLLTSTGLLGYVTENDIIKVIFNDLFGTH